MAGKGSKFERDICYRLSAWWTGDPESSVFWRSSMSGGRATVRGRKGKRTEGHAGDVAATTADAEQFLRVVTLELKRGYSKDKDNPFYFLDGKADSRPTIMQWIDQARKSAALAKSMYWMIVAQRDRKETLVYMPASLFAALPVAQPDKGTFPMVTAVVPQPGKAARKFVAVRFDDFLQLVKPEDFKRVLVNR